MQELDASMSDETPERPRSRQHLPASNDTIRTVTSETFRALVLEENGPVVVEFMSYGCAHCRALEPVLQQVAEMVKLKAKIFRVNVATEKELAASYEIQGTPTLVMFLNGSPIGRAEGPQPDVSNILAVVTQPFE